MTSILCQRWKVLSCAFSLLLAACSDGVNYAPVSEINTIDPIPKTGFHQVSRGETLYEIAFQYGLDYRYLAERNRIKPPYTMRVGQKIFLQGGSSTIVALTEPDIPVIKALHAEPQQTKPQINNIEMLKKPVQAPPITLQAAWTWPAKGKVIGSFSSSHKGINIAGTEGESVYAAAGGKVVYCGSGLRGYGNLIILKHNSFYLSAYAHNRQVLVKEGDFVKQGQKIAEMGNTGTDRVMLHFEIRHAGKPIDPVSLLGG